MKAMANPARERFVSQIGDELTLAQVLITRGERGFELRHVADRAQPPEALRLLALEELRPLAQFTAAGAFRPLKSAPNLPAGWRVVAADAAELEAALNQLYPGAQADWFAAQSAAPPVTSFRDFTRRQTGMYRITQKLTDAEAEAVVRAGCHRQFCLKRRLWTVAALAPDAPGEKSLIPCLEPCALLLEFARKAVRLEQAGRVTLDVSSEEAATLAAALETAQKQSESAPRAREGDFSAPDNPRRLQLLLEKLRSLLPPADDGRAEE